MKELKINWQKNNPVGLIIKESGGDETGKHKVGNFDFVNGLNTQIPTVWFQGQNYLYPWEIDDFIEGLQEARYRMIGDYTKKVPAHKKYRRFQFKVWLF